LVNGVCGGCDDDKFEPPALRLFPLVIDSFCCWDDAEREFDERGTDFVAPLLPIEDVVNDDALPVADSFPLFLNIKSNIRSKE
jgi:hypothetical protein